MENYEPQISTVLRLRNIILGQWLWNVAPGPASAPALPGILLEMQTIGLHLSSTERTGPTTCVFTSAPHDSDAGQSSQTTLLGPSERVGGAPLLTLHTHKSSKSKSKWTKVCGLWNSTCQNSRSARHPSLFPKRQEDATSPSRTFL